MKKERCRYVFSPNKVIKISIKKASVLIFACVLSTHTDAHPYQAQLALCAKHTKQNYGLQNL